MARLAAKRLADERAMEEQYERHNPVRGAGATPSMGLSQFRGGGMLGQDGHGQRMVGAGFWDDFKQGFDSTFRPAAQVIKYAAPLAGPEGLAVSAGLGALGYGRKKKSDAHKMGKHLSMQVHKLHGAGFWDDFKEGFDSVMKPAAGAFKAVAPLLGPEAQAASGVANALGYGRKKRGAGFWDEFKQGFDSTFAPAASAFKAVAPLLGPEAQAASGALGAFGYGRKRGGRVDQSKQNPFGLSSRSGAYEGMGKKAPKEDKPYIHPKFGQMKAAPDQSSLMGAVQGLRRLKAQSAASAADKAAMDAFKAAHSGKGRRASAGPSDKRRARGAAVSRLMKQGMSLGEASRHIKEHGM